MGQDVSKSKPARNDSEHSKENRKPNQNEGPEAEKDSLKPVSPTRRRSVELREETFKATPPVPPPDDERIDLTPKQKFAVEQTWREIESTMKPTGVAMFLRLFENNQELLDVFEKFQNLEENKARAESIELRHHAKIVMRTLNEAVKNIRDLDELIDKVHKAGRQHNKIRGFKKEYFWEMREPFLHAMKQTLGNRYTDNIDHIYTIVITFIIQQLTEGYEKGRREGIKPED